MYKMHNIWTIVQDERLKDTGYTWHQRYYVSLMAFDLTLVTSTDEI